MNYAGISHIQLGEVVRGAADTLPSARQAFEEHYASIQA